ncbi:hypothetical protein [Lysobacter sp. CA196]|uniref:hypothetical protein n=1 Tax=Lysobacter sp. CA196 TaxID=3455606 RepID=UPI003F8D1F23
MKDNRFLFGFVATLVGCFSLAGLYVAIKGPGGTAVESVVGAAQQAPAQPRSFKDGDDVAFLDGTASAITTASVAGGECALDYLGQDGAASSAKVLKKGAPTKISGWAALPAEGPVKRMLLEWKPVTGSPAFDGFVALNFAQRRDDVAAAKGGERYRNSGYDRYGLIKDIPVGTYRLYLVLDKGDELFQCDLGREVAVE